MTILRILLDAPPAADREADWALFDNSGRAVSHGRARPDGWPAADAREAVVAASLGRVVTLTLPPLPPGRVSSAAAFALEDQLAGTPDESHAAFGGQSVEGYIRAIVIANSWLQAMLAASERLGLRWQRVLLESDLAHAPEGGWCWCAASIERGGFVRTDRGTTIAIGRASDQVDRDSLPAELVAALATGPHRPLVVRVDIGGASESLLAEGKRRTSVDFVAGKPWRWYAANESTFAAAVDLQTGRYDANTKHASVDPLRALRPALWIGAAALAFQILATLGSWLWLHWESAATQREMTALARRAAPDASAELPASVAIARQDAVLRHRAGLTAQDDFLPLLARAAPALSSLPAGAIRAMRYADAHVVLELQKVDAETSTRLQRALQIAGLTTIAVPTAGGERLRVGLD